MNYPIDKVVNVILSLKNLNKMSNFATGKAGKDVRVLANMGSACFSHEDYWTGLNIQLGKKFYQETFNDRNDIPAVDLKPKYINIATILYGAYYHELFHVLFTPFKYAEQYTYKCPAYFRQFAHQVSNILEDITIEGTGVHRYPFTEPYINKIKECFTQQSQIDMLTDAITKEPDAPGTMIAYLLHFCRETDLSSFPEYKLWNDNKEFIEWGAYKCINTIDPYLRVRRQLSFALELCKILEMKQPSKDNMENPDMSQMSNESSSLTNKSMGGMGSKSIAPMNNFTDTAADGPSSSTQPQATDEDIKVPEGELKEQKAERGNGSSGGECPTNSDLTKEGITMLANDDPVSNYTHFADKLSRYVKTEKYMTEYTDIVRKHDKQIRQVVAIVRKMIAQNNTGWNRYQMSGTFDVKTAYKKDNYKFFKKKNAPNPVADLVFEILVDNSGSMSGTKAKLAGRALIIFCEALDRLHIPFSVDAFTEGNTAITISLKDYDETYSRTKTNMTLFTEQFDCRKLCTWSGNIDEINLHYVSNEIALRKEKDKVIIVISDGATCGSWRDLKQLADNIEGRGITVLGVGIFDENVQRIYKNNTVLKTTEDLEGLGAFLNKYLIGKIFK